MTGDKSHREDALESVRRFFNKNSQSALRSIDAALELVFQIFIDHLGQLGDPSQARRGLRRFW